MILDIRYHIFTITAVFAALGLGILIGTSIIGNDGLVKKQQSIIDNIAHDLDKIRNENMLLENNVGRLKKELNHKKKVEMDFLTLLMKKDKMIKGNYILYTNNKSELKELQELFGFAGASLKVISKPEDLEKYKEKIQDINKLIFWKIKKEQKKSNKMEEIRDNLKDKIIYYQSSDLIGLFYKLMESRPNEKEKSISVGSGS